MLSIKRLSYIIALVLGVSIVFMVYNINEERSKNVNIYHETIQELDLINSPSWESRKKEQTGDISYYIIGSQNKEMYQEIFKNVCRQFADWKIPYVSVSTKFYTQNLDSNSILIFCDESISSYCDLKDLGEYISCGGKVIFAAGLPEGEADSYLNAYWGISEKSGRDNYNQWNLVENFLPIQYEELLYDGYNLSSRIFVRDEAKIYMKDKDTRVPLIYTYDYEKGSSCVFNGTFLTDANCTGFLAGALGIIQEDFIYPVFGVKCVFLDNFPMITYVNDKACMKLYGRNTEAFVRDIVWPMLQGISLRNGTPFTSSVLTVASDEESFPEINNSLFSTIGKSALQFGGELAYAVNTTERDQMYMNKQFILDFESVFNHYDINGITMVSEDMNLDVINKFHSEITSIRGRLNSENEKLRIAWDEKNFTFPGATYGNNMENGNLAEMISVLTAYGTVSHSFDINLMIAENDETPSWNEYKKQVGIFETKILSKIEYLEGKTLSQLVNYVKSYKNLEFLWREEENKRYLYTENFIEGQTFFFHTKGKIVNAEGVQYSEIGNGYYLLKVIEPEAVIELDRENK